MAKDRVFVNLQTMDGEDVSFTVAKDKLMLPEFGIMYTINQATNPKSEKSIIIPWHQVKKLIIDTTEEEDNGNK